MIWSSLALKIISMKINIPHIHKIEGDAGFWAEVTKQGKVKELKMNSLLGLRQIEGILVGRKVKDVPLIIARICGICPVVHILNAVTAIEKALDIQVSPLTVSLRKLILASQMIQSHALHLFFMALPDFLDIENDFDLMKKFPKEAKAALKIRDYSLDIIRAVGGRAIHPLTPKVGGFTKMPERKELERLLKDSKLALENALILNNAFKKLTYPKLERKAIFASVFSKKEYAFYQTDIVKIKDNKISVGDFYSNKIEESLTAPPVKRVKFQGESYMLGAIARIKNNKDFLNPQAKKVLEEFITEQGIEKDKLFDNVFYNLFFQYVEVVHFIEEVEKITKEILTQDLKESPKEIKIKKGTGLSAMEAPRGTLFDYIEVDEKGRIFSCNIITPSAQFLNNLEDDLRVYLPDIIKLSEEERIRKLRSLVRVYDPCISCATH